MPMRRPVNDPGRWRSRACRSVEAHAPRRAARLVRAAAVRRRARGVACALDPRSHRRARYRTADADEVSSARIITNLQCYTRPCRPLLRPANRPAQRPSCGSTRGSVDAPRRDRLLPRWATSTRCSEDALTGARARAHARRVRKDSTGGAIPMCGVPFHAADGYIARLVVRASASPSSRSRSRIRRRRETRAPARSCASSRPAR